MKKVSVLMPAYNCERFIEKAISSILNQTYRFLELVICDDGSTDGTWAKINSFSDSRIRKYQNNTNRGYLQTFNFLLSHAQGDFITGQDADDWSEVSRIETQLQIFQMHENIHLVGCNGKFYYSDNIIFDCPLFQSGYVSILQEVQPFILPAILYKKEVLQMVKGFHPYFDGATSMDQYFIFNILSYYKGYAINQYLYTARFNAGSNTRNLTTFRKATAHEAFLLLRKQRLSTGSDWIMEGKEALLLEFEKSLFKNRRFRAEKYREYAAYKIDSNDLWPAFNLLLKALLSWPMWRPTYQTIFYLLRRFLKA